MSGFLNMVECFVWISLIPELQIYIVFLVFIKLICPKCNLVTDAGFEHLKGVGRDALGYSTPHTIGLSGRKMVETT